MCLNYIFHTGRYNADFLYISLFFCSFIIREWSGVKRIRPGRQRDLAMALCCGDSMVIQKAEGPSVEVSYREAHT